MKLDKATAFAPTRSALATPLSSHADHACPNVRGVYFFILKAFFITGVLGWVFIASPAAVADDFESLTLNLNSNGWNTSIAAQYNASQLQQNTNEYQSADGLHAGVRKLRQVLSNWWARNPHQSSMTSKVQNMVAATGEGPYAAWSYKIDASGEALAINIRYQF